MGENRSSGGTSQRRSLIFEDRLQKLWTYQAGNPLSVKVTAFGNPFRKNFQFP
jgi:hypothetical protein